MSVSFILHMQTMISRHAPQFSGKQQQDSQELVAFLLERLHEDLNLVKRKPSVDMDILTQGREDKVVHQIFLSLS